ncbi:hypothetical protein L1887_44143 [Cichorium endivia]|nr:hypothetical protein L1887_44143 [Cichorium endivia]
MVAQFDNQLLRGLLPKRYQLDARHHRALHPAVAEAQRQLARANAPAHAEPGHTAELALHKQRQPFGRTVRFPALNQARKRRPAIALLFAQLARFPAGEKVDAEKALLHLLDLPAFERVGVGDPACLNGPLQPLRPAHQRQQGRDDQPAAEGFTQAVVTAQQQPRGKAGAQHRGAGEHKAAGEEPEAVAGHLHAVRPAVEHRQGRYRQQQTVFSFKHHHAGYRQRGDNQHLHAAEAAEQAARNGADKHHPEGGKRQQEFAAAQGREHACARQHQQVIEPGHRVEKTGLKAVGAVAGMRERGNGKSQQ